MLRSFLSVFGFPFHLQWFTASCFPFPQILTNAFYSSPLPGCFYSWQCIVGPNNVCKDCFCLLVTWTTVQRKRLPLSKTQLHPVRDNIITLQRYNCKNRLWEQQFTMFCRWNSFEKCNNITCFSGFNFLFPAHENCCLVLLPAWSPGCIKSNPMSQI